LKIDALRLSSYFGERDRVEGRLYASRLLELFGAAQVHTSALLRGVEGYGASQRLRTDMLLSLSEDLPVLAVAVDERERIERLLAETLAFKRRGLITLEHARLLADPAEELDHGEESKLTIYLGRHERIGRRPAFVAACELLARHGASGATVLLGVDGTLHGERLAGRFFSSNARVPLMIVALGTGRALAGAVAELWPSLDRPVATLEPVCICKRDGQRLGVPPRLPERDEHGLRVHVKLTLHSSESARSPDGREPLHRALVRSLRAAGASGATSLRGIWGFAGSRPPHGDRLLALRRHVPVMTIVIQEPARMHDAFAVIDRLTAEEGLLTSELVPAAAALGVGERVGRLRLARTHGLPLRHRH
jgi:PII-like signaling protein